MSESLSRLWFRLKRKSDHIKSYILSGIMDLFLLKKYILKYKIFWGICGMIFTANLVFYASVIDKQKTMLASLQEKYSNTRQLGLPGSSPKNPFLQYKMAEQSWQTFILKLPQMSMVTYGIKELKKKISTYGSSVNKLVFRPEKIDSLELWKYSIEISVIGRYENVRQLLADIQNSPSLFCIEKLSVKRDKQEGSVNLKLGIATYCRL